MSDSKHTPTPGPWTYVHTCGEIQAEDDEDRWTLAATFRLVKHPDREVMHANGRLMAAAPDMRDALRAVEWGAKAAKHHDGCGLAAALAKAEGREGSDG